MEEVWAGAWELAFVMSTQRAWVLESQRTSFEKPRSVGSPGFPEKIPRTETSGILTGKWLQLTNANIWLVQLFLYHHYLWTVLDEEINDIKWWIISKSF